MCEYKLCADSLKIIRDLIRVSEHYTLSFPIL